MAEWRVEVSWLCARSSPFVVRRWRKSEVGRLGVSLADWLAISRGRSRDHNHNLRHSALTPDERGK